MAAECGDMIKSPLVVNASLIKLAPYLLVSRAIDLPADSMLFVRPVCALLAVKDIACILNVLFELSRDLPLSIVSLIGGR